MSAEVKQTQRIEYIDALRGFTMILVVLHHVSLLAFGCNSIIEKYSYEIRMPLFFFISGFLMSKSTLNWTSENVLIFIKKKTPTLIVSPILFLFIYIYVYGWKISDALMDPAKAGYWFTFMLFNYFLIYIVSQILFDKLKMSSRTRDYALIFVGLLVFLLAYVVSYLFLEKHCFFAGFIGGGNLKYFLFLCLGTLAQKHFDKFEKLLDSTPLVIISIVSYFLMNIFYTPINSSGAVARLFFILLSACFGLVVVWAFFRKYKEQFSLERSLGRLLQNIGRRTLEVYLLHYFIIPRQLGSACPIFSEYNLPLIEFVCSLTIAFLIISVCLGISAVLRVSPTLGCFLFGERKK